MVSLLVPDGVKFGVVTLWCLLAVDAGDPDVVSVLSTVPVGVSVGSLVFVS